MLCIVSKDREKIHIEIEDHEMILKVYLESNVPFLDLEIKFGQIWSTSLHLY